MAPGTDAQARPVDLAAESVAGEEDPGASIDVALVPGAGGKAQPGNAQAGMAPGDEAPAGTPGTGEKPCPACGGSGKQAGKACPHCKGRGVVTVGIGGG